MTYESLNPGDANGDHKVDINDLTIVLTNYNQSGAWATGDFNGDAKVDINDLTIVLTNYNQTYSALRHPRRAGTQHAGAVRRGPGWAIGLYLAKA